ncbi:MAG: hypothetical protein CXT73_06340, partial [Methanobacteriota archaeon]
KKLFEDSINLLDKKRKVILKKSDVKLLNNNYKLNIAEKDYTFEEFEKLELYKSSLKQYISLNHSVLIEQNKYLYSINPHKAEFDKIINNSDNLTTPYLDNHLLLKFGNITEILYCFVEDIIDPQFDELHQEFLFKLYFPKLYKLKIKTLRKYKDDRYSLDKPELDKNTEELMSYLQKECLKKTNKGITNLHFIIHPQISMKLPMELIFKLVNSVESIPLIKYNPGERLENRYRLYTGTKLSKKGKKIPYIVSGNSYKISKLNRVRKILTNENRVSFFIEENEIEIYCQFIEDGNIEVKLNIKKSEELKTILSCLRRNLNDKILSSLNSYLTKSGYIFTEFRDLNHESVEIIRMDYEYELESEDYKFDLKKYENCLTHIFNIKKGTKYEKTTDIIEMKYKKVSLYNKMNAMNEFISIKLQHNVSSRNIITELIANFKLTRVKALDLLTNFMTESGFQLEVFSNKSFSIAKSSGFDVKIEMKQNANLQQKLYIKYYNINNEKYLNYIDKYTSFLIKIIENKVDEHYKKLCSKVEKLEDGGVDKDEVLPIIDLVDKRLEKENQLKELDKLRGSEDDSSDDGKIDAFATKDDDDSSDSDSEPDMDDFFGGGGGEKISETNPYPDENLALQDIIRKTYIKREQIGGMDAEGKISEEVVADQHWQNVHEQLFAQLPTDAAHVDPAPTNEQKFGDEDVQHVNMLNGDVQDELIEEQVHPQQPVPHEVPQQLYEIGNLVVISDGVTVEVDGQQVLPLIDNLNYTWTITDRFFDIPIHGHEHFTAYELTSVNDPTIIVTRLQSEIHPVGVDEIVVVGGAKKELTFDLDGRNNYFVNRIRNRFPDLALKERKSGFESYVRTCPANLRRTPMILSQEEYDDVKDEIKEEHPIAYKDEEGQDNWFICPRFWCFKDPNNGRYSGKSLTLKQIEEGACGGFEALIPPNAKTIPDGKFIFEFTDKKYHDYKDRGKDPKNPSKKWKDTYKKHYPGFVNKKNSKGLCMPCCFNMTNKKTGEYEQKDARKRMEDECCKDDECAHLDGKKQDKTGDNKIPFYASPIRGKKVLKEGQLGYLPESLEYFFQFDSKTVCQISKKDTKLNNKYCLLRLGVRTTKNQKKSFLSAISLTARNKNPPINTRRLNINKGVDWLTDTIIKNISIEKFLIANKGNLYKTFFDEGLKTHKLYTETKTDKKFYEDMETAYSEEPAKKEYEKIKSALNNFLNYIKNGENVNYQYLWDLITAPIKECGILFINGINLLIFNNPSDDPTDKIEIICPTGAQFHNYKYDKEKPWVMLYKTNNTYEPLIFYKKNKSEQISLKININEFEEKLGENGKKILNVIKYISNDIEEKCRKFPNSELYESKYKMNISLTELLKKIKLKGLDVSHQIVNDFYETIGIMLKNGNIFIPCEPSAMNTHFPKKFIKDDLSNILQDENYPDVLRGLDIVIQKDKGTLTDNEVLVGYRTNTNQIILVNPEIDVSINDYAIDRIIKTDIMNIDTDRIESIKKIKMAKNYYIFFRNLFKLKINNIDNIITKKEILDIIEDKHPQTTYIDKMDDIIEKLKLIMNSQILNFDLNEKDALSLCEYLEKEKEEDIDCIGIAGDDNIHHFPKQNLINGNENEEHYYNKLSDELIRYDKIKKYIFLKNKYMNFDIVKYKISNSEILLLESSLKNIMELWKKDELMTTINYIKYKNIFDTLTNNDKETYTNKFKLKILDLIEKDEEYTPEPISIDIKVGEEDDGGVEESKEGTPDKIPEDRHFEEKGSHYWRFKDGFGNDVNYKFASGRAPVISFAMQWWIKYVLMSPPEEIKPLINELKSNKNSIKKKWKNQDQENVRDKLWDIFLKYRKTINWDKHTTGNDLVSGKKSNIKVWVDLFVKFTTPPAESRFGYSELKFSSYEDQIGTKKFDKEFMEERLKKINTFFEIYNPSKEK